MPVCEGGEGGEEGVMSAGVGRGWKRCHAPRRSLAEYRECCAVCGVWCCETCGRIHEPVRCCFCGDQQAFGKGEGPSILTLKPTPQYAQTHKHRRRLRLGQGPPRAHAWHPSAPRKHHAASAFFHDLGGSSRRALDNVDHHKDNTRSPAPGARSRLSFPSHPSLQQER